MFYIKRILYIALVSIMVSSCLPSPYYQKVYNVPKNAWSYDYTPSFKFEITDTTSAYRMYFVIRHTEAYQYANIWLLMNIKQPGDSSFAKSRVEVPLAQEDGKWLGRGMGELYEQRIPLTFYNQPQTFSRTGTYEVKFEQNMRHNPLTEILQIGLRIEKDTKRNLAAQ